MHLKTFFLVAHFRLFISLHVGLRQPNAFRRLGVVGEGRLGPQRREAGQLDLDGTQPGELRAASSCFELQALGCSRPVARLPDGRRVLDLAVALVGQEEVCIFKSRNNGKFYCHQFWYEGLLRSEYW